MKFDKITAVAKGFLTRRLLQTEKLKHLKQTVKVRSAFLHSVASTPVLVFLFSYFFLSYHEIMYFLHSEEFRHVCPMNTFEWCIAYCYKV